MSYGFEIGQTYNRVKDIHGVFGGSPRGGIITTNQTDGTKGPIFIVTGASGLQHGYDDRWRADGAFEYFGEGQFGDMQMTKGNRAIATQAETGRSILLFAREKNQTLRFRGEFIYDSHHTERAPDRDKKERDAFVFVLWPIEQVVQAVEDADAPISNVDIEKLRQRAYAAAEATGPGRRAPRNIYERSKDVRDYVLARARGVCEGCGEPAPFVRTNGAPYLEPHHIHRRSDGGPDHPGLVIALDPTCHRRVHFGADGAQQNAGYLAAMALIEPGIRV